MDTLGACYCSEKSASKHAVVSAYLSIAAGIWELSLSVWVGHAEKSMSVYGIGIMAFVDIAGSILVLSLWQCGAPEGMRLLSERRREMLYSGCIGAMMIFLGLFLLADSLQRFLHHSTIKQTTFGLIDGVSGTVFGVGLATYKYYVGKSLDSPVVLADAVSSFCGGMASCLSLLVFLIDDEVWWSDSTAGFTSAFYTFYSGITTVISANAELSKLNRLERGGPRLAPNYVRKLAKGSSSDLYHQEPVQASLVEGGAYDEYGAGYGEARRSSSGVFQLDWLYRLLGVAVQSSAPDHPTAGASKKYSQEGQHLLPPHTDSEDHHRDVLGEESHFTA